MITVIASSANPDDFDHSKSGLSNNKFVPFPGRTATNNHILTNEQIAADMAVRTYQEKYVEHRRLVALARKLSQEIKLSWYSLPPLAKAVVPAPRNPRSRLRTVPQTDSVVGLCHKQAVIWVLARYANDRPIDLPTIIHYLEKHGHKTDSKTPRIVITNTLWFLAKDGSAIKEMYLCQPVYRLGPAINLQPADCSSK